jgi:hypothetical protein
MTWIERRFAAVCAMTPETSDAEKLLRLGVASLFLPVVLPLKLYRSLTWRP